MEEQARYWKMDTVIFSEGKGGNLRAGPVMLAPADRVEPRLNSSCLDPRNHQCQGRGAETGANGVLASEREMRRAFSQAPCWTPSLA